MTTRRSACHSSDAKDGGNATSPAPLPSALPPSAAIAPPDVHAPSEGPMTVVAASKRAREDTKQPTNTQKTPSKPPPAKKAAGLDRTPVVLSFDGGDADYEPTQTHTTYVRKDKHSAPSIAPTSVTTNHTYSLTGHSVAHINSSTNVATPRQPDPPKSPKTTDVKHDRSAHAIPPAPPQTATQPPASPAKQWRPPSQKTIDLYSVGGARSALFRAAKTAISPVTAAVPLVANTWHQQQPTTPHLIANIWKAMVGSTFEPTYVLTATPASMRRGRTWRCEPVEDLAPVLGAEKAAQLHAATYSGHSIITFSDTTPIPPTHVINDQYSPWGKQHPPAIQSAARALIRTWADAHALGVHTTVHNDVPHDPLTFYDVHSPPLQTHAPAPAHFSPTATILNAYADAITKTPPRSLQHHGTIGIRNGHLSPATVKQITEMAPSLLLGQLWGHDRELLWVCNSTTDHSLSDELNRLVSATSNDGLLYDVSVRARRPQCKHCFGPAHSSASKCPGKHCSSCGLFGCPRATTPRPCASKRMKCRLCDELDRHDAADCPLANGARYDLKPGLQSTNATLVASAAKHAGITPRRPLNHKPQGIASRDKSFAEASIAQAHNSHSPPLSTPQNLESALKLAQTLLTGLALSPLTPDSAQQRLLMAERIVEAAAMINESPLLPDVDTTLEEKEILELEAKLSEARRSLAQKREKLHAIKHERRAAVTQLLHDMQQVYDPPSTLPQRDQQKEAAGALVVLAKAQDLKDTHLKPAIVQRVRELISASPAANQPPTAAALPSTPPPPNATAMECTTTAPPSAGSQAAARPALNAAPPHVTATSHTTSTHPPTGDPPPASVRPASTAQPTSSQQ